VEAVPWWIVEGKKMANEAVRRMEELLPGLKEKTKEIIPGELPAEDVTGEDIKRAPRYRNLISPYCVIYRNL